MKICGKVIKIKVKPNVSFILIENNGVKQIVVKNIKIDKINIGDVITCIVTRDNNNNGKFKTSYESFLLDSYKIESRNIRNYQLDVNKKNVEEYCKKKYEIRKYLNKLGYLEVAIPTLTNGETSSKAESFSTDYSRNDTKLFLRKTMDSFLRMYSCSGFDKIYSIGNCFRNGYLTSKNKPEFEMLSIFSNYLSQKKAMNIAVNIIKIITSKNNKIVYIDDADYKKTNTLEDTFYVISNYDNLTNSYSSVNDFNKTDEFKIKYKDITIVHGVSEISDYEEYNKKINEQGKKRSYGELQVLEDLISSGAPPCYNLGISIVRLLSLYNDAKIKDFDFLSFDRLGG